MAKHDLLTAADEFSLSKQFKLGLHIKNQAEFMSEELGRPVTAEELSGVLEIPSQQIKLLVRKGELAKMKLVRANMRLVFHIAGYYKYRGVAYPDLVQEGTFGLIRAVEKYDADRGFRFSTYASWWVKQAVSRAIAEKSRLMRLPVHIHDLMVSMSKVESQFVSTHNRKPTTAELAERLALPIAKVELLVKSKRSINSIDDTLFKDNGKGEGQLTVKDRIPSGSVEPSSVNEMVSINSEVRRSMLSLSEREAKIVEMRFGLGDGIPKTLEEIGKHFQVTRERVRQIESRALLKLRRPECVSILRDVFQDHTLVDDNDEEAAYRNAEMEGRAERGMAMAMDSNVRISETTNHANILMHANKFVNQ